MATQLTYGQGTLLDVMNSIAPDGNLLKIAEVMDKAAPMFKEAKWAEANKTTQHIYSRRFSLPVSERIKYNKGVGSNIGSSTEVIVEIEARGNRPYNDKRLVDLSPNPMEYRANQAHASIEGMAQDVETDLLYGSIADGTCAYDGLSTRLNALADQMVVGHGGTGSFLSSIYLVAWDNPSGAFLAYPKGSQAGIKFEDKGQSVKDMPDGTRMDIYEDYIESSVGLCIGDLRSIGRIANIDTSVVASTGFDEDKLIYVINQMPAMLRKSVVAYASRKVKGLIDMRANAKGNAFYTKENVFGEEILKCYSVPIRLDEMISEAETVVA